MQATVQIEIPNTGQVWQGVLRAVDKQALRLLVHLDESVEPLWTNMLARATLAVGGMPRQMTVSLEVIDAHTLCLVPVSAAVPFERRKRKRYPVNLPARVWAEGESDPLAARVVNISVGGIGLQLPRLLEVGTHFRIELDLVGDNQPLQLTAQVRQVRTITDTTWYIGAAFMNLSRTDELWLRKLFP